MCIASSSVPRNLVTCLKHLKEGPLAPVAQGGEDLRLRVWDVREAGRLRPSLTIEGYTFFPVSRGGRVGGSMGVGKERGE